MRLTRVLRIVANTLTQRSEKEVVIKAPWGNIAALSWGDPTKPPVFLVHGKLDACSSFRPLVSLLPDSYFYVSMDLPGNGWSDHLPRGCAGNTVRDVPTSGSSGTLPRGVRYSAFDLMPSMLMVKDHFKWDKFAFIGHSLGVLVGKYFNLSYPNFVTKVVELDPLPAYFTWLVQDFQKWYHYYYEQYYGDKYHKWNGGKDTAPKYTYEKIQELMMKARGLSKEATTHILERSLEPAGDGLYRITYDQRMKFVPMPPFSPSYLHQLFTSHSTPTFGILAKQTLDKGEFDKVPFVTDPKCWPNNNYKVKIVEGNHDVHIENPGCMAADIAEFLKDL